MHKPTKNNAVIIEVLYLLYWTSSSLTASWYQRNEKRRGEKLSEKANKIIWEKRRTKHRAIRIRH